MRKGMVAVAILALLLPVLAEAQRGGAPGGRGGAGGGAIGGGRGGGRPVAGMGVEVPGWWARLDDPAQVGQGLKFAPGANAVQFSGPAGIFWDPQARRTDQYTVSATVAQPKAQSTDAYGVFFGGEDLAEDNPRYSMFVVRADGRYLIATRQGAQLRNVGGDWTEHAAIRRPDGSGTVSNELSVRVAGGTAVFSINGQVVAKHPVSALSADGLAGLRVHSRVNELRIDSFRVE